MVSSAFAVTGTNLAAIRAESIPGSILGENAVLGTTPNRFAQDSNKGNIATSPMASALTAVETISEKTEDTSSIASITPDQFAVTAQQSPVLRDPEEDGGVSIYTVVDGDTVSTIASRFHITVNTILWANDMDNVDSIRPGDQIFILPVAGVSYTVKDGDTIESIATQFKAESERIIAYNNLPANGRLESGQGIIIPDGQRIEQRSPSVGTPAIDRRQYVNRDQTDLAIDISGTKKLTSARAGAGHRFPYGYCTWYVAQKRYVPWSGNAGAWLFNAKSMGYATGRAPRPGSIMVTTESRAYGHVALVEKVGDGVITVSEMNYTGWGKVSRRTLSTSSRFIKGYIY